MLKIKSNTNEFTIILSEKIGKKINAEKFSVPALSFFLLQCPYFPFFLSGQRAVSFLFSPLSSFSVSALLFFCFSVSASPFFLCQAPLFFFYSSHLFLLQRTFLLFSFSLSFLKSIPKLFAA